MWGTPVLSAGVGAGFRITPTHVGNTFGTIKKATQGLSLFEHINDIAHQTYRNRKTHNENGIKPIRNRAKKSNYKQCHEYSCE